MSSARVLLALLAAVVGSSAKEVHNNWIYFDGNATVTVNFSLSHYVITDKQPYEGVSVSGDGIKVRAGRKETAPVAAAFVKGVTAINVLATEHMLDALPHKLNFAIFGNLTLSVGGTTAECVNFRIAQGHYSTHNNWWMGGDNCVATPTTQKMTCRCSGMSLEFHSEGKSDHIYLLL
eukprot:Hpha_TRINITY_DN35088_c0_g1::TRINITY_DN35088_c0_g1_i1::g.82708::m.82708